MTGTGHVLCQSFAYLYRFWQPAGAGRVRGVTRCPP